MTPRSRPRSPAGPAAPRVPKFLRALYEMLQAEDPAVLAWAADGACFQILDTRRLETQVLPKYFKHSKFASFQRQLNNFGFRKWTKTQSSVCTFSHQQLTRCHPAQLADLLQRQQQQQAATAATTASMTTASMTAVDAADGSPLRSPAHKRPLGGAIDDGATASPRAVKHIKREPGARQPSKLAAAEVSVGPPWELAPVAACDNISSPQWSLDPALFGKPMAGAQGGDTPTSLSAAPAELAFSFSLDDLNDLVFAAPDTYERTFELRMLNECLDLAPPGSFVSLLANAGGELGGSGASGAWSGLGRPDMAL